MSHECMGGEERYESAVAVWDGRRGKVRISCECMEGEERYESAVNVWKERKGTNHL